MNDINTTARSSAGETPTAHWIEVRDASGRRHLEMRWGVLGLTQPQLSHAA